jgi:hypothetical protein
MDAQVGRLLDAGRLLRIDSAAPIGRRDLASIAGRRLPPGPAGGVYAGHARPRPVRAVGPHGSLAFHPLERRHGIRLVGRLPRSTPGTDEASGTHMAVLRPAPSGRSPWHTTAIEEGPGTRKGGSGAFTKPFSTTASAPPSPRKMPTADPATASDTRRSSPSALAADVR